MGFTLDKAGKEVLGSATKVVITKDSTLIVTDGSTREAVDKRVTQIRRLVEVNLTSFSYAMLNALLLPGSILHHKLKHKECVW